MKNKETPKALELHQKRQLALSLWDTKATAFLQGETLGKGNYAINAFNLIMEYVELRERQPESALDFYRQSKAEKLLKYLSLCFMVRKNTDAYVEQMRRFTPSTN